MKRRLLSIFLLTLTLAFGNYRPPNMEKDIFDAEKIKVSKISKTSLFSALLSVARDFNEGEHDVDFELRGHALAIAGRLDPDSENFKDVLDQLEKKGDTVGREEHRSKVAGKIYRGVKALLRVKDNEDNTKCASYCVDIALRIDPGGPETAKLEELQKEAGKADWDDMLGEEIVDTPWGRIVRPDSNTFKERSETIPGGKAPKIAATQRSIYGLSVRKLSNGRHAGAASSLSATALRDDSVDGVEFHIDQKVGNTTGNSLEEIKKLMRVRHEEAGRIPSGYKVEIAFEDKDGLLDGPSAGTAMSAVLDSLFTGKELDDAFAVTGAITADGKVTRIGGVAGKIRGATRKNCTLVGVPHSNIAGVSDILVLDGIEPLINIQVFSFKTLDETLDVAYKEKPENVQATIDDFKEIADLIKDKGEEILKNSKVIERLEGVVEKMPNHQSARILLEVAKGKEQKILSVGGSLHEVDAAYAFSARKVAMIALSKSLERSSEGDQKEAGEAYDELMKLDGKIDTRLSDYHKFVTEAMKTYSEGPKSGEDEEDYLDRLIKIWGEVGNAQKKLMSDPEIMEELRG
ncbi:MAG: S16 family serine protease [Akkermansiaceae bacterium]